MPESRHELWLARHGETEWSLSGQHTGITDIPLTENGREQAKLVGERLAGRQFAAVLTSPMTRARETARLAGYGDQAEIDDRLMEWNYGEYEGRTTADIRKEVPGWTVWTHPTPGGESAAEVGARADAVIERVRSINGNVIIFSHGHFLRVLGTRWIGLPPEDGARFALSTGTFSVLGYERDTPVFRSWNEGAHL
jgi:broad specificity phosphatase PhoE